MTLLEQFEDDMLAPPRSSGACITCARPARREDDFCAACLARIEAEVARDARALGVPVALLWRLLAEPTTMCHVRTAARAIALTRRAFEAGARVALALRRDVADSARAELAELSFVRDRAALEADAGAWAAAPVAAAVAS